MSDFLSRLKEGLQDAQRKFAAAQQTFTATQAEFQQVQQRMNREQAAFSLAVQQLQAYQTLVNLHSQSEQSANGTAPSAGVSQAPVIAGFRVPSTIARPLARPIATVGIPQPALIEEAKPEINKTETVRQLLRGHPAGMTPNEIWKSVQPPMTNRVYLYSILKRLKDRGDVKEKRGKYYLEVKPEIQVAAQ